MQILIAGGSGLLGRALMARFERDGHRVNVLTRRPRPGRGEDIAWNPDGSIGAWSAALESADAVVNLAGEGIADKRWSEARKSALRSSRLLATRVMSDACSASRSHSTHSWDRKSLPASVISLTTSSPCAP